MKGSSPNKPIGAIDRANHKTCVEIDIDRGNADPIANGKEQVDKHERFAQTEDCAKETIDAGEKLAGMRQRFADHAEEKRPKAHDEKERNKGDRNDDPTRKDVSDAACRNGARQSEPIFKTVFERVAEGKSDKDRKNGTRDLTDALDKPTPCAEQQPDEQDKEEYEIDDPSRQPHHLHLFSI